MNHDQLIDHAARRVANTVEPKDFSWERLLRETEDIKKVHSLDNDFIYQRVIIHYCMKYDFDFSASTLYAHWLLKEDPDHVYNDVMSEWESNPSELRDLLECRGYSVPGNIINKLKFLRENGMTYYREREVSV